MITRVRGRHAAAFILSTAAALTTVTVSGTPASAAGALDGVWRMDGYGTVLSVEDGGRRMREYETTGIGCLPGDVTELTPTTATLEPTGPGRARLGWAGSVGHRTLRRVAALPATCRDPKPAKDARAVFDTFWQTYAENYPFFKMKGVDWQAVRDRYRPHITNRTTDDELFTILTKMVEPLHDGHTYVTRGDCRAKPDNCFGGHRADTPFPSEELIKKIDASIAAQVGADRLQEWGQGHGKGKIAFAELPDGTGYLRLTGFVNYTDDHTFEADSAELDRALDAVFTPQRVRSLRGLVLDLRFNGGGSDRLGLHVAERLTNRPYTAYLKQARNDPGNPGKFTPAEPVRVLPHRGGPVYTGPVALLTGRLTISAGETTTQALMGRAPGVVRIGQNTNGSFSDVLERRLPNEWRFGLPNEVFRDAGTGRSYDGDGIAPDVRTPVFTDAEFAAGRDSALTEARRRLTSG
ncbi:S41 family peptidase [Streptomyces hesseae]|uniref:S41 family peptidase n=1 Tax=Streptomyces hesseae TaxID=3075519 RepID=A0ABU2SZQ3_9ACTN|nr:S41 family peptidase [Streptomyces sp. DSM 40473]MDT0454066.1 S41 family peptidase [Streptomyces sp. DSM 40473]